MTDNSSAVATKIDWTSLSGLILDGGYELKEVLDGRDNAAKIHVRILGSGGRTAVAYFLHLEPADAADQLDIWNTLRDAPHPNVSRPVVVGKKVVSGCETVYMVLADADEKLAAVVPERPLEWEEAAEVLHSCEKGLAHLHAHGLIHGAVSPQTVEAVGYSVQLNPESVRRLGKKARIQWGKPQYLAPESKGANLSTAADVWCLGATLFEVLSQEAYGTPGVELEKGLPLGAVIQRCLDKNPTTRCTLKEAPGFAQAETERTPTPSAAVVDIPPAAVVSPTPVETSAPDVKPSSSAKTAPLPPRPAPAPAAPPVSGPRPDSRPPARENSAASARSAAPPNRIPQPLTPKQVTKDDMALVPVGKRHRRVQKRQGVGARIRTLNENEQEPAEEFVRVAAPAVSARMVAVGNRSNLVRNIIAGVGLLLLFAAAIKFIILPKLSSTEQIAASDIAVQPASDSTPDITPTVPAPGDKSNVSSRAAQPLPAPVNSSTAAVSTVVAPAQPKETELPSGPRRKVFFRVVLSFFDSRADAVHEMDSVSQQHPELILHVTPLKNDSGDEKYAVVVGGNLTEGEADPLRQRLVDKGLKNAHLQLVR